MGWGGRFRLYYVLITVLNLIKRGDGYGIRQPSQYPVIQITWGVYVWRYETALVKSKLEQIVMEANIVIPRQHVLYFPIEKV